MSSPARAVNFTDMRLAASVDLDETPSEKEARSCWARLARSAPQWKLPLACCLAVGHGWASATCLIVYRTYASIMTGNVLSLATDCIAAIPIWTDQINEFSPMRGMLTSHYYRQQCAVHGSVFSSYCFGIAVYRVLNTLLGRRASASAIAVICAALFVAVDITRVYWVRSPFQVCYAAVALGIVNAVALKVHGLTTHMITVHTQKTVLFVMDLVFKDEKTKVDVKCKGIRESTALAGSFLGGAVGGASLMAIPIDNWRFSALGALFFLLLCAHDFVYHAAMADVRKEAASSQKAAFKAVRGTFSRGDSFKGSPKKQSSFGAAGGAPLTELVAKRAVTSDLQGRV